MKENPIQAIIDTYLAKWISLGVNKLPGKIETDMADPTQNPSEEWRTWFPIPSRVTEDELCDFEEQIGYVLPLDFKVFLQHKHFYDLKISEATFTAHPVNRWRYFQTEMMFNGYPREYLADKGLLAFANWSDWGLLCFDTNRNDGQSNYPVVQWDHELPHQFQNFAPNFYQALLQLDEAANNDSEE
jgi:hypothetical protein